VASLLPCLVSILLFSPQPRSARATTAVYSIRRALPMPPSGPQLGGVSCTVATPSPQTHARARARARTCGPAHQTTWDGPRASARARAPRNPPFRHRFGSFLTLPFPRARPRGPSPLPPVVKDTIDPFQRHARPLSRGPFRALVERHQTPHQPACAPTATRFQPTLADTDRGGASPSCAGGQSTSAGGRVGGAAVSLGQPPGAARGRRRCAVTEVGSVLLRGGSSAVRCFDSVDCFVSLLRRRVGPL